ncbi:putative glycosyltransferase [Bacillus sp. TS-2]|nr:putative glycosyltransferase [Bacillus sp. TS-2]
MIDDNLKISIILPVYNRKETLIESVNSILLQTYIHFELIIVDDSSTEDIENELLIFEDTRIKYIRLEKNVGAAIARNIGVKQSSYSWIAFQDSDDKWLPTKLEEQVQLILSLPESKRTVVYTSFKRIKDGISEIIPSNKENRAVDGEIFKSLILGNFITTQSLLIKKEIFEEVGGFNDIPRFQDWELCLRISMKYNFYWISKPLVDVYYTSDSISSQNGNLLKAFKYIYVNHKEKIRLAGSPYFSKFLCSYGHNLCLYANKKQGQKMFLMAIKLYPFYMRVWLSLFASFLGKKTYHRLNKRIKSR